MMNWARKPEPEQEIAVLTNGDRRRELLDFVLPLMTAVAGHGRAAEGL